MPESLALVAELRGRRIPAVVSGAGPTVLAFVTEDAETVARTRSCRMAGAYVRGSVAEELPC